MAPFPSGGSRISGLIAFFLLLIIPAGQAPMPDRVTGGKVTGGVGAASAVFKQVRYGESPGCLNKWLYIDRDNQSVDGSGVGSGEGEVGMGEKMGSRGGSPYLDHVRFRAGPGSFLLSWILLCPITIERGISHRAMIS